MILGREYGPVGDWWFEGSGPAEPSGRESLRDLLRRTEVVAQILESARLLRPDRITFRGWLGGSLEDGTLARVDGEDLDVPLEEGANGLAEIGFAAASEAWPELYPVVAEVSGKGAVLDGSGAEQVGENVAWLAARTLDHHVVSVFVQSDAFLPWGVDGTEQTAVWKRNAPRLEEALGMISRVLGAEPWSDSTPHAHVDGFRLLNRTDAEGDVVPTSPD